MVKFGGNKMELLNINGTKFPKTDTIKIYNLSHELKLNFDIFIQASDAEALEWILSTNEDDSARFKIIIDEQQEFEIKSGNAGDRFSNPIIYYRNDSVDSSVMRMLPSYNRNAPRLPFFFIGGSTGSSYGAEWSKQLNPQYVVEVVAPITGIVTREIRSEREGEEVNYLNYDASDFVSLRVEKNNSTNDSLLNYYMKSIIIVIEPSTHEQLEDHYQYNSAQNYMPRLIKVGVTY